MAASDHEPKAPNMRSFSLKSDEAHEALCSRADRPWIPNGALPREPKWGPRAAPVDVAAADGAEADEAIRDWMRHLEAGRIG